MKASSCITIHNEVKPEGGMRLSGCNSLQAQAFGHYYVSLLYTILWIVEKIWSYGSLSGHRFWHDDI
jgi:hypothetical protein